MKKFLIIILLNLFTIIPVFADSSTYPTTQRDTIKANLKYTVGGHKEIVIKEIRLLGYHNGNEDEVQIDIELDGKKHTLKRTVEAGHDYYTEMIN